jgi:hypothetical protein
MRMQAFRVAHEVGTAAAALYKASHLSASPAAVKRRSAGRQPGWNNVDDWDRIKEPLVNVDAFQNSSRQLAEDAMVDRNGGGLLHALSVQGGSAAEELRARS